MRALLIVSRFPFPPYTGDRIRATAWIEALMEADDLTVVAPPGRLELVPRGCQVVTAARTPVRLLACALHVGLRGLPATSLLAAGFAWRNAIRAAETVSGPFDVAIVQLARLDPWVFRYLPAGRRILDAIDALGANLSERAAASLGVASAFWRQEAARTARLETECGRRYDAVSVVAPAECAAFGSRAVAISHGTVLGPPASGPRDIDAAFWGRLAYFANEDAARFLLDEVWPAVRRRRSRATLLVAGADAPAWLRRRHGHDGVTVESPLRDRAAALRRVRVAIVPLRFGSGASNKVLEAAEASCAVVSTPEGVRGLPELAAEVELAHTAEELASRLVGLCECPAMADVQGRRLREVVESCYSRDTARRRLLALARGVATAGG
ncbi:MAG: glycosyltransferase [Thermoanaerobaculaceae bacterium]|nr:glycosyltransferase [Thermoanaerobaculaceae bacterium]MDI9620256.1 glycosyltransferase [Acidobacteriota bacterium]NLH11238.1 glycosyltransferase [Holophagae bacterium]HPW56453.1 glycosyltransferase [Thermoanaerobaculaceae bacterium]